MAWIGLGRVGCVWPVFVMLCPTCNGKARIVMESKIRGQAVTEIGPCPDCLNGIQHCCEGDQEQPTVIFEPDDRLLAAINNSSWDEIPSDVNPNET